MQTRFRWPFLYRFGVVKSAVTNVIRSAIRGGLRRRPTINVVAWAKLGTSDIARLDSGSAPTDLVVWRLCVVAGVLAIVAGNFAILGLAGVTSSGQWMISLSMIAAVAAFSWAFLAMTYVAVDAGLAYDPAPYRSRPEGVRRQSGGRRAAFPAPGMSGCEVP